MMVEVFIDTNERKLYIIYEIMNQEKSTQLIHDLVDVFMKVKSPIEIWQDDYNHQIVNAFRVKDCTIKNVVCLLKEQGYNIKYICNSVEEMNTILKLSRKLE